MDTCDLIQPTTEPHMMEVPYNVINVVGRKAKLGLTDLYHSRTTLV